LLKYRGGEVAAGPADSHVHAEDTLVKADVPEGATPVSNPPSVRTSVPAKAGAVASRPNINAAAVARGSAVVADKVEREDLMLMQ
jgi:hypothetical protein